MLSDHEKMKDVFIGFLIVCVIVLGIIYLIVHYPITFAMFVFFTWLWNCLLGK